MTEQVHVGETPARDIQGFIILKYLPLLLINHQRQSTVARSARKFKAKLLRLLVMNHKPGLVRLEA